MSMPRQETEFCCPLFMLSRREHEQRTAEFCPKPKAGYVLDGDGEVVTIKDEQVETNSVA
jgi:hypothetical protein